MTISQRDLEALLSGDAVSGEKLLTFAHEYQVDLHEWAETVLPAVRSVSEKTVLFKTPLAQANDAVAVQAAYQKIRNTVSRALMRIIHPFYR
jgi:hypothetical protein